MPELYAVAASAVRWRGATVVEGQMDGYAISADSHIVEAPEVFAGLAERFGDEAPRIMNVDGEVDAMIIPSRGMRGIGAGKIGIAGVRLWNDGQLRRREGHKPAVEDFSDPKLQAILKRGYAGLRRGIREADHRWEDQEADGVKAELLYPSLFFGVFGLQNLELLVACFRSYNDWLADYCSQAPDRLYGLALIPLQDPAAGLEELERAIRLGFRGGCIPCTAPAERPYRDPAYEPIWAAAQEATFPLSLHIGTNSYLPREGRRRVGPRDPIADYACAANTIQRTLSELICQGVAHRYPELKFVVTEFNSGWIGHWLDRLDQGYDRARASAADCLDRRPSEYWSRQFLATLEDDRAGVLTRELVGVHTLLWGNDYPHLDSTWPCSRDVRAEIMRDVPEEEVRAMTVDNVRQLYQLELYSSVPADPDPMIPIEQNREGGSDG